MIWSLILVSRHLVLACVKWPSKSKPCILHSSISFPFPGSNWTCEQKSRWRSMPGVSKKLGRSGDWVEWKGGWVLLIFRAPSQFCSLGISFRKHLLCIYIGVLTKGKKISKNNSSKGKIWKNPNQKIYYNLNSCKYPCFSFAFMHSLVGLLNARVWDGT